MTNFYVVYMYVKPHSNEQAESPQNLILFVENQREGSLGRQLQDRAPDAPPVTLNAEVIERTPLEGDELLEYIRQRGGGEGAKAKEEEEAGGDAMDIDLPGSPEGEAAARLTGLKSPTTTRRRGPTHLDPDSSDSSWQTSILIDGFKSDAALAGPMFPWTGHAAAITAVDEFGEVILPGEFTGYFQEEAYDLGTNPGDPAAISADPSDYANTVDTSDPFVILTDPDQPFKIERHSRQIWFTMQVPSFPSLPPSLFLFPSSHFTQSSLPPAHTPLRSPRSRSWALPTTWTFDLPSNPSCPGSSSSSVESGTTRWRPPEPAYRPSPSTPTCVPR